MKIRLMSLMLMVIGFSGANAQTWNLAGNAGTDPTTMFIGTTDSKALRFRTNNGVRMHISSFGKIGIGTTNPIFKMDLVGGSYNTDSLYRIKGVAVLSRDNTNRIQLGDGTVSVGIGTATPTTTLQVNGTVTATEFIGGGAGITALDAGNINSGILPVSRGGTGASTAGNARIAIGAAASGFNNDITALNALTTPISIAQGGIGNSSTPLSGQILIGNGIGYSLTNMSGDATLAGLGVLTISSSAVGSAEISDASISSIDIADGTISNIDISTSAAIADIKLATISTAGKVSNSATSATSSNTANTIVARDASGSFSAGTASFTQDIIVNGISVGKGGSNGIGNTAIGQAALNNNTTGSYLTANGLSALGGNVSGYDVTAVGANACDTYSSIINSVFVGSLSDATTNSLTNAAAIGYNTIIDASNKMRFGNTAVTSIGGQVAWTTFSDGRYKRNVEEDVPGLEFITKLRPVTYTSDITGLNKHYPKPALREGQRQAPEQDVTSQEAIRYSGFIAQEVETAAKEIGYDFSGVDKPQREGNLYGLRYSDFVVPMVKAIQEQQEIIEKQQKEIAELKSLIKGDNSSGAIKIGVTDGRDEILLGQNIPNPADNSTIIPFSIPTDCKSASILITDHATGRAIKAVPLSCKDTHLMLDAGSLASGTYSYSLFVDGVNIDTKQMVIVK